ncbi:hypothetical protein [Sulfitobacter guttiformis]|uniref:Uncharacterized protein n=1 Tax=Sulfitobacter guttiformis TaxID=74349 RepID=A0A420DID3_9RHOB|nr:hypothetical protein [Sulfitobacter guttiformis]KIN72260.1 hypothetical protein Z949_1433 [Sulfitobacter guttiformis KCTC 32187]RKE93972.1 hypothetical protein C8N30_3075 [Sulfitobacter guttiformis]
MSHDTFNERIARINNHSGGGRSNMTRTEGGTATSMYSSPSMVGETPTARRNIKPMLMGAVLGMVGGTVAAGLENPAMPWGPGFEYNEMIVIPALLALCAGPVMAIAASAMRARFPSFFFFAAAYFPCVIATALLDLPLF